MPGKSYCPYLHHILDAIDRIETYLESVDESRFLKSPEKQDAVIRQLQVLGEAANRLSGETRSTRPEVPWRNIAGMRDKLVHDYFGVDLQAVWVTAKTDVPALRDPVMQMLGELGCNEGT